MGHLTFLGTGGGRFVFLTQRRHSGGVWLGLGGIDIIIDPGPASLVRALEASLSPQGLDAVVVTHNHLDHYNDAELMIEAMTCGMKASCGIFACQRDVLDYISDYHLSKPKIVIMDSGKRFFIGPLVFEPIPTKGHAEGLGIRISLDGETLTYSSDTDYEDGMEKAYMDSKVLILNTLFPLGHHSPTHLCTDDALRIADMVRPELLILNHFGIRMLNEGPATQARIVEERTGVRTLAAYDGMRMGLGRCLEPILP